MMHLSLQNHELKQIFFSLSCFSQDLSTAMRTAKNPLAPLCESTLCKSDLCSSSRLTWVLPIMPHLEGAIEGPRSLDYRVGLWPLFPKNLRFYWPDARFLQQEDSFRTQSFVDKFRGHNHTQSAGQNSTFQTDCSHYQLLFMAHLS